MVNLSSEIEGSVAKTKRPIVMLNPVDHPVGTRLLWTLMAGSTVEKGPVMEHPHELTVCEWSPDGRVSGSTIYSIPVRPSWHGLDIIAMMGVLEILPPVFQVEGGASLSEG